MVPIDDLKGFLDEKVKLYNSPAFIQLDPISIPHRFSKKEDIEIAAFLSATIAWGNRKSILISAEKMMTCMNESPYDFIMHSKSADFKRLASSIHRTFNKDDFTYFISSLRNIYANYNGLETLLTGLMVDQADTETALSQFKKIFFELNHPIRTLKHIADPMKGSTAKRLNMFLRWMVRKDNGGVDFGIWSGIRPSTLCIPLDVHTGNIARKIGVLHRTQNDWTAVKELDQKLRSFDLDDPVKYDFALFGLGAIEKFT